MMNNFRKPLGLPVGFVRSMMVLMLACLLIFSGCGWLGSMFGGNDDDDDSIDPTPMPTPKPKVVVSWDQASKQLLYNSSPQPVKGFGYYFIGEVVVELQKRPEYVEEWLTYLESKDINYIRTFVESTFLKSELDAAGIPTRQIFKMNAQGKYILTTVHQELDLEWVGAMSWLADRMAEHGMALCLVLVDHCMHKCYGTDIYGWPTNQYNVYNNDYGEWDYYGQNVNCNFFKYYNLWNWKYDGLLEIRQNVILTICNMARSKHNIVLELTNEGAPEPAHIPYDNYPKFENWMVDLINNSYAAVNRVPILCDSSDRDYVKSRVNWSWSHNWDVDGHGKLGRSTDGRRCTADGMNEYRSKMATAIGRGEFTETHAAYPTKCIVYNGVQADSLDVGALMWFGTWPVNMQIYEQYFGPWFDIIKNAPSRLGPEGMVENRYYDPNHDAKEDRKIDGKDFPF